MGTISFNEVPASFRVPFVFVEFDNTGARQGLSAIPFTQLVVGQKLAAGSQAVNTPVVVTSAGQANTLFGAGSMIARMIAKALANNSTTKLVAIAVDDNGGGAEATGSIDFSGPATESGTLNIYIGGDRIQVGVVDGDSDTDVASAVQAAIAAATGVQVTAAINGGDASIVDLTAKHKGTVLNSLDVRVNYFDDDEIPAGIGAVVTPMSGGTGDPGLTSLIAALGDVWYQTIAFPWNDAASLTAIEAEMADRFGPIRQIDGVVFTGKIGTLSELITFGDGRNSPHVSAVFATGEPIGYWEKAAAFAGQVAFHAAIDPARPFQTLVLNGILPAKDEDQFTLQERNLLLFDGIATTNVDAGGLVRIERAITMYQQTPLGAPDDSYLDVNTLFTLQFLRFDFRTLIQTKYPRHKLSDDGTRIGPGQAVITPLIGRAEAVARFKLWEEQGLVEGLSQFKDDLIVERNGTDVNRLDFFLPPDLVNQFRVAGVKIGFLL